MSISVQLSYSIYLIHTLAGTNVLGSGPPSNPVIIPGLTIITGLMLHLNFRKKWSVCGCIG